MLNLKKIHAVWEMAYYVNGLICLFYKQYEMVIWFCPVSQLRSVSAYGVYTDMRSEIIKGSFPVKV